MGVEPYEQRTEHNHFMKSLLNTLESINTIQIPTIHLISSLDNRDQRLAITGSNIMSLTPPRPVKFKQLNSSPRPLPSLALGSSVDWSQYAIFVC